MPGGRFFTAERTGPVIGDRTRASPSSPSQVVAAASRTQEAAKRGLATCAASGVPFKKTSVEGKWNEAERRTSMSVAV
jgi:hypothetical protein